MNYINYTKHTLYTPDLYHRRFDQDLAVKDTETAWENQAKRVALAALPYVSLYKPAGSILSAGMGAYRAISHLSAAFTSEGEGHWQTVSVELFHAALAVFSVASSVFNFTLGLAIQTSIETIQGLISLCHSLYQGEYRKAAEETLQILSSALYLGFMISGSLEAMLAFALFQAVTSFVQAQGDFSKGKYLEAASKMGMGFIRLYQAKGYVQQIERRKQLQAIQKYADFMRRVLKGREVRHILTNPLADFKDAEHAKLNDIDLGAYFHGYGKGLVKGANLAFRTKIVDGKEITELDFKVNHVFHDKIQGVIQDFSKLESSKMKEILEFTQSHATGIRIDRNNELPLGDETLGDATKITFGGLGSVFVGTDTDLPTMYDRIVIQMDADKTLYDFHELMALIDIDQALQVSTQEEIERLKMGHLFRIFYPREATPFERTREFFDLPLDQLKQKMIEKAPEMETVFEDYFAKMTPQEIIAGKMRYRVNGLAEKAYESGARGLTAAVTGAYNNEELFPRIAGMLKMGMLSTETRAQGNMNTEGLSSSFDFYSGGADSVFTQMVTEKNCSGEENFDVLAYHGKARFLISLDALETGTYQYFEGEAGTRRMNWWGDAYKSRPSVLEFVEQLQNPPESPYPWWEPFSTHEVMLKERIDPSFFTGLAVDSTKTRDDLMNYLRSQEIIQLDSANQETILGKRADQFIRVTDRFSEDLFA